VALHTYQTKSLVSNTFASVSRNGTSTAFCLQMPTRESQGPMGA
jgi:hypothetical protein